MSKSKSTTKVEPWGPGQQFVLGGANAARDTYNAQAGNIANIAGQVQGLLPGLIEKYNQGNPALKAATGYATDTLQGRYLNNNPHLQGVIDQTNNDVRNQVGASLGTRGRTGGDSYFGITSRALAENENKLRYGDYSAERDRQQQAAAMSPGLAAADYAGIAPVLATAQAGTELPFAGSSAYADSIAKILGNYKTETTTQKPGFLGTLGGIFDLVGKGASAAGAFSDRRLKEDIKRVGTLDDGLGVYTYRYKGAAEVQMGVMADEVAQIRPEALGADVGGFATVHYGAL